LSDRYRQIEAEWRQERDAEDARWHREERRFHIIMAIGLGIVVLLLGTAIWLGISIAPEIERQLPT
jgi:hypothetical protein